MDKKELNKGYRYVDTDSALKEDSELFLKALESIQKTACAYPSVMKSEMHPIKPVTYLTVLDVMRVIEDKTYVFICTQDDYRTKDCLYVGKAQEIPTNLYDKRVLKFKPDYLYSSTYYGSILDIIIENK